MLRGTAVAVAACAFLGCTSASTSLVVELSLAPGASPPPSLSVEVWQADQLLVGGAASAPPGRLVIEFSDDAARTVCVAAEGGKLHGSVAAEIHPHQQAHASLQLSATAGGGCHSFDTDGGADLGQADQSPDQTIDLASPDLSSTGDLGAAPAISFVGGSSVSMANAGAIDLARPSGLYNTAAVLAAYRGVGTLDDEKTAADPGAPFDAPSVTAARSGELLVVGLVADGDFSAETLDWQAAPLAEREDVGETALYDQWQAATGTTGSHTATLSVNGANSTTRHALAWSVLLQP